MGQKEGHWVMLLNIHFMRSFLKDLEDKLAVYFVAGSHANFKLFLTYDPLREIPIGLIERSIKLKNEPPTGIKANLLRAFVFF
jgi:dynein heavy chain